MTGRRRFLGSGGRCFRSSRVQTAMASGPLVDLGPSRQSRPSGPAMEKSPVESATLKIPPLGAGVHKLSASYGGSAQFAPAVSPTLLEQTPASGVDFSLSVSSGAVDLTSSDSATVLMTIVPTASLQQQVQLSCTDGVPRGYECSFHPVSLYGGTSYLQIQRPLKHSPRQGAHLLYGVGAGILSFFLVGIGRRRVRLLALMLVYGGLMMFDGCGASSSPPAQPRLGVLSMQATAGTGASTVVHSAQVFVKFTPPE